MAKAKTKNKGITSRSENYSEWYTDIVLKAELADYSPVKGCMVIRPRGYAIWENIHDALDAMIKETGHQNAYFPLFIPESFLKREAEHVEGFAPECAVVTHAGGSKLEEPLVVRPTSETIMYDMFGKWIKSYRDLPLLMNQWANVVRWEMRTRLFLRTCEFLWQEGHTAHETFEDAEAETRLALEMYRRLAEEWLAMPVFTGIKSDAEKFAGAQHTYCIEAMMQDGKSLQAGTSHNLGQNFAKGFDVQFQDRGGELAYVWSTSWGVSTRLMGALIMTHSDDKGLIVPPRLAAEPVVVVPIYRSDEEKAAVLEAAAKIQADLKGVGLRVIVDDRDQYKPGFKFNEWELRGVPLRIELGPRDLKEQKAVLARRDTGEKSPAPLDGVATAVQEQLEAIQKNLFERAKEFRDEMTCELNDYGAFKAKIEGDGGFVISPWCGSAACETKVKDDTKATIRLIPLEDGDTDAGCIVCGMKGGKRAYFARAY